MSLLILLVLKWIKVKLCLFPYMIPWPYNVLILFIIMSGVLHMYYHIHIINIVTFIDNYSRFTWIYFVHAKFELFEVFNVFFSIYWKSRNFINDYIRFYSRLLDTVHSLLLESFVLAPFWPKVFSTAVHLINHLPSSHIEPHAPYFSRFGRQTQYYHLHTFGRACFVFLPLTDRTKLIAHQKGYFCYDPLIKCIRVSQNVVFFETQYFFQQADIESSSQKELNMRQRKWME